MSFTCPVCQRTSYHPEDEKWGYCGACHDFTGGYGYGDQRHRSSSTPAGQEREMRMPTNDEDGKAQPEMPEVPRQGNSDSLLALRGERMGRKEQPRMPDVSGSGIPNIVDPATIATVDPPQWMEYPSKYRFYLGACALGTGLGISWTLSLTSSGVLRHVSKGHVITFLYVIVAVTFAAQGWMLYRWDKALKKRRVELAQFWDAHLDPQVNPYREKI
jgi:hypothetical protein